MARRPLFLPPAGYRQRRVRDAARLLPVLGAALLMVPLLWTPGGEASAPGATSNAHALIYVFAVWAALVAGAGVLARHLRPGDDPPEDQAPVNPR